MQADEKKDEKLILCEISGQYFAVNKLPIEFLFFFLQEDISIWFMLAFLTKLFLFIIYKKFTTLHWKHTFSFQVVQSSSTQVTIPKGTPD